jgi:hypothetical protein
LLDQLESVPEGGWYQANQNRFDAVWTPTDLRTLVGSGTPPPSKIVSAWSGFAWDCRRGDLLLYGGGHANYSGNDVYRWRATTRMWERVSLPSQVKLGPAGNFEAVDGPYAAPSSAHTYDNNVYLPHADRFFTFGGGTYNSGGSFTVSTSSSTYRLTGPYVFDPAKADPNKVGGTTGSHVQRVAPYPNIQGSMMWENRDIYEFAATVAPTGFKNQTTAYASEGGKDVVYLTGLRGSSAHLYRYVLNDVNDPLSDTIQQVGRYGESFSGGGAGAYDPSMRLFVRTAAYGTNRTFTYWNLNNAGPTNNNVNFMPQDLSSEFVLSQIHGMDFDPVRRQYVLWAGGGTVWQMTPPAQPSRTGWTIRKAVTPPTQSVPAPFAEQGGVFGKWKYVAELDAFVALQDINAGNIWIYKPVGWQRPAELTPQ